MNLEGASAILAGFLFFGVAAGVERFLGMGPGGSALLEELGKALLLAAFCGPLVPALRQGGSPREVRVRLLRLARRLSLGLVAVAVFAGVENLAYLFAFPEAGVLARLAWSVPVHLAAGLGQALGFLLLFSRLEGGRGRSAMAWLAAAGGLCLAAAWHAGANLLVSGPLSPRAFTVGAVAANLLCLALLVQFLKHAYLGGFLHGSD